MIYYDINAFSIFFSKPTTKSLKKTTVNKLSKYFDPTNIIIIILNIYNYINRVI